jgi:hypothetical protein
MSDVKKLNVLQVWTVLKKAMFAMKTNALMYAKHRLLVAIMLFVFHKYIVTPVSVVKDISGIRSLAAENDCPVIPMITVQTLSSVISIIIVAVLVVHIEIVIQTKGVKMENVFKFAKQILIALTIIDALIGNAFPKLKANVKQIVNVKIIWRVVRTREDLMTAKICAKIYYVVVTQFVKYAITCLSVNVIQDSLAIQPMRSMAVKQSNVLIMKTVKRIKFAIIIIVSILVVNKEYVAIMPFALQNNTQPSVGVRRASKEIQ